MSGALASLAELPPAPRDEVLWFATMMERKLRENDHKTGWKHMSWTWLLSRLRQEYGELERRVTALDTALYRTEPIDEAAIEVLIAQAIREAADVGNFAMMIADVVRETHS